MKDLKNRLSKARSAFVMQMKEDLALKNDPVTRTNPRLYKTLVAPVLLYGYGK